MKIRLKTGKVLKSNRFVSVYGHKDGLAPAIKWLASRVLPEPEGRACGYMFSSSSDQLSAMCYTQDINEYGEDVYKETGFITGGPDPINSANVIVHVSRVSDTNNYVLTFVKPAWDSAYLITE